MKEYPVTTYKGFTIKPIVFPTDDKIDEPGDWFRYSIEGQKGKKKRVIKGSGLYKTPDSAAMAAVTFSKHEIDSHLARYRKSAVYRFFCNLGYCPVSKY